MKTEQKEHNLPLPPADKVLFLKQVQRGLGEIREEVEVTCKVVSDVRPVPQQTYDETSTLLKRISTGIPMPDMMWLEDGGIGLEWRPGDGIITMSLYGDEHVNCVVVLDNQHEIARTCPLSDRFLLPNFLTILPELF